MAAYARSLIPALLEAGDSKYKGLNILTVHTLAARANHPNIVMEEEEWQKLLFTASDKEDWDLYCVHRGAHQEPIVYKTLESLNNHLKLCYPGMNPMVKGKCDLGVQDHPVEKRKEENKKIRTV